MDISGIKAFIWRDSATGSNMDGLPVEEKEHDEATKEVKEQPTDEADSDADPAAKAGEPESIEIVEKQQPDVVPTLKSKSEEPECVEIVEKSTESTTTIKSENDSEAVLANDADEAKSETTEEKDEGTAISNKSEDPPTSATEEAAIQEPEEKKDDSPPQPAENVEDAAATPEQKVDSPPPQSTDKVPKAYNMEESKEDMVALDNTQWALFQKLARLQDEDLIKLACAGVGSMQDLLDLGLEPDVAKQAYQQAELDAVTIARISVISRYVSTGMKLREGMGISELGREARKMQGIIATASNPSSNPGLAEDGLTAVSELNHFFCCSNINDVVVDDEEELRAVHAAIDDLDRVLSMNSRSQVGNVSVKVTRTKSGESDTVVEEDLELQPSDSVLALTPTSNSAVVRLTEMLHVHGLLKESAQAQIKEMERVIFFTDVPDRCVARQEDNPGFLQLKHLLAEMELAFAHQLAVAGEQAHQGYKEAERILFFTDLPDNNVSEDRALAIQGDNPSLLQLQQLLSKVDLVIVKQLAMVGDQTHRAYKEAERVILFTDLPDNRALSTQEDSLALLQVQQMLSEMEMAFAKELVAVGEKAHEAYKEAERVILFTDLPDAAPERALATQDANKALLLMEEMLSEMEVAFAKQVAAVGEQAHQAYKEWERTILFTDVPDNLNYSPGSYKSQGMLGDLERQLLFTDVH